MPCINSFENHSLSVNDFYLDFGSTIQLLSTGTALEEPISMQALALPNFALLPLIHNVEALAIQSPLSVFGTSAHPVFFGRFCWLC